MYQKLLLIAISSILLLSCGGNDDKPKYRIGVSQCSGGFWREKLNSEMQRELLLHDGITMELRCAYDDDNRQISDIQHFIDEKVDAIIVSPNSEEPITEIIGRAYDEGIPVVLFDRFIKGDKYSVFVGGDNIGVGEALATFMVGNLNSGDNVIELMGNMQTSPARQRHEGFIRVMENHPELHLLASVDAKWDGPRSKAAIDSLFKIYPKVDAIVAHSDFMTSSAKAEADSLRPGSHIKYIGADGFGSPGLGIFAVAEGKIDATAVYPTGGDVIMRTAIDLLDGKKVERLHLIRSHIVSDPKDASLLVALNDELTNEAHKVMFMRDKVVFFTDQLKMERTMLFLAIALLVVSICLVITFVRMNVVKQRANVKLQEQQDALRKQRDELLVMTQELEEATHAKLVFFTNISHDFRTPLSLISAPIESAMKTVKDKVVLNLLGIAHRNVFVLLDLVNQILDFRKVENGKMELKCKTVNLREYLEGWVDSFRKLGEQKDIGVTLSIDDGNWMIFCDWKKIERMVYNIVGNSMKFTPSGGSINLVCYRNAQSVTISVKDTGKGMSKQNLNRIFERFYRIENSDQEGTGIGLALVKVLVDLMHGNIEVASNDDPAAGPTGTTITLTLPVSENVDVVVSSAKPVVHELVPLMPAPMQQMDIDEDENCKMVLVIDDNDDIRSYLFTLLAPNYKVVTAVDGKQGVELARKAMPDIILCDVMMPVMDGLECCRIVKNDPLTCHIPVVMLTACSLDEQKVKGLAEGAEIYISKPFSSAVLLAQVESTLKNRLIMKNFYGGDEGSKGHEVNNSKDEHVAVQELSRYDREFLQKLKNVIEEHLHEEEFNVESLAEMVCMSRSQVYRKCKALVGESPVEMIRNSRLIMARELLETTSIPVSDIAKKVGIPDPSYFSKCYKAYFGVVPSSLNK